MWFYYLLLISIILLPVTIGVITASITKKRTASTTVACVVAMTMCCLNFTSDRFYKNVIEFSEIAGSLITIIPFLLSIVFLYFFIYVLIMSGAEVTLFLHDRYGRLHYILPAILITPYIMLFFFLGMHQMLFRYLF
jgi:hypothetical protein